MRVAVSSGAMPCRATMSRSSTIRVSICASE
ncbi:Uncharacterised protein [Bordetella pertussis]|nr:Uncharacterised protein [Bordetella pertussis]